MIIIDNIDEFKELNDTDIQQIKQFLEILIREKFQPNLNLSRLDSLYFPNDFDKAVIDFQIQQGLSERGATKNEMGTAFGKTFELEVNGEIKDRVFIRKQILWNLILGDNDIQQLSLNILHHELCHVHDNDVLANMKDFHRNLDLESNTIDSVLNCHAMNLFSEYIVPKMAVSTKNQEKIVDYDFLTEIIDYTQEQLNKDIEKFKTGNLKTLNFFHELQLKTSQLLKTFTTIIGELDGISRETALYYEQQLDLFMDNYYINECWLNLKTALRKLNKTYPKWTEATDLEPLKDCILQTWNLYGVYPDESEIRIINNNY